MRISTGRHVLTIDQKNRLSIPASIRAELDPKEDGQKFYLLPGSVSNRTLRLYSESNFERYVQEEIASMPRGRKRDEFNASFYSMIEKLEVDKQGRVVLPQENLRRAGLGREVVLAAAGDHFILWNRAEYTAKVDSVWEDPMKLIEEARGERSPAE